MTPARNILVLLLLPLTMSAYLIAGNHAPQRPRAISAVARTREAPESLSTQPRAVYGDVPDALLAVTTRLEVDAYLAAEHEAQLAGFYAGVQAELDRQAAAARAAPRPASRPAGTVGECTGFAIPDYIIQRESGGNPSAYNPSGAYGCAETLLSHYSSGSCRGLDPHTIEGQRACVDILSNGGSNLAPWAATR